MEINACEHCSQLGYAFILPACNVEINTCEHCPQLALVNVALRKFQARMTPRIIKENLLGEKTVSAKHVDVLPSNEPAITKVSLPATCSW
jgi:hypothetical protein